MFLFYVFKPNSRFASLRYISDHTAATIPISRESPPRQRVGRRGGARALKLKLRSWLLTTTSSVHFNGGFALTLATVSHVGTFVVKPSWPPTQRQGGSGCLTWANTYVCKKHFDDDLCNQLKLCHSVRKLIKLRSRSRNLPWSTWTTWIRGRIPACSAATKDLGRLSGN